MHHVVQSEAGGSDGSTCSAEVPLKRQFSHTILADGVSRVTKSPFGRFCPYALSLHCRLGRQFRQPQRLIVMGRAPNLIDC